MTSPTQRSRRRDRLLRRQRGEVARDEMAVVFLHALLSTGKYEAGAEAPQGDQVAINIAARVAVQAADALLDHLYPGPETTDV